ncbi:MAG TPA: hypothetical protein PKZ79_01505 [Ottowia sp.]|nr:hypothetical protein [Ottowia sp.]HQO52128.1 hypothetical protein [Ottowia sp.]
MEIAGCKSTAAAHFSPDFLPKSPAIGLQIRQKLVSLEPILATPLFENGFGAPSPTASQKRPLHAPARAVIGVPGKTRRRCALLPASRSNAAWRGERGAGGCAARSPRR